MKSILVLGLCLCVPSTVPLPLQCTGRPDGCDTPEEAIKLGRARIEAEKGTDPFEGFERDDLKEAVLEACASANRTRPHDLVHDEYTICLRRGRRTAEDLLRHRTVREHRVFDANSAISLRKVFNGIPKTVNATHDEKTQDSLGVWFNVKNGVVDGMSVVGGQRFADPATNHFISYVAWCASLGAFQGKTFQFIGTVSDGCLLDPFLEEKGGKRTVDLDPYDFLPILSYSRSKKCMHHTVIPTTPWLHAFPKPMNTLAWSELKDKAIWRGSLNHEDRGVLVVAGMMQLVKDADFAIAGGECSKNCQRRIGGMRESTPFMKKMPNDMSKVCSTSGVCSNTFLDQLAYKPLVVMDGIGAVTRFQNFFSAPGVVVEIKSHYEVFFSEDVVPFVHYIGVSNNLTELPASLNAGLSWLRDNDADAEEMSSVATLFHDTHLTFIHTARAMQIYASLMHTLWDPTPSPTPNKWERENTWLDFQTKSNVTTGLDCDTFLSWFAMDYPNKQPPFPYKQGCGRRYDNVSLLNTNPMVKATKAPRTAAPSTAEPDVGEVKLPKEDSDDLDRVGQMEILAEHTEKQTSLDTHNERHAVEAQIPPQLEAPRSRRSNRHSLVKTAVTLTITLGVLYKDTGRFQAAPQGTTLVLVVLILALLFV